MSAVPLITIQQAENEAGKSSWKQDVTEETVISQGEVPCVHRSFTYLKMGNVS